MPPSTLAMALKASRDAQWPENLETASDKKPAVLRAFEYGLPSSQKNLRQRSGLALDGGRSPFCRNLSPLRLPAIALARAEDAQALPGGMTATSLSHGRRVCFTKSASRQLLEVQSSPFLLPASPLAALASPLNQQLHECVDGDAKGTKARRKPIRRNSQVPGKHSADQKEPEALEECAEQPSVTRKNRRPKTWTATENLQEVHVSDCEDDHNKVTSQTSAPSGHGSKAVEKSRCRTLSCSGESSAPTPATTASNGSDKSHSFAGPGGKYGWSLGSSMGSGSFGCVFKAIDKQTGFIFAVKRAIIEDNDGDTKYRDILEAELSICKALRHPNIVGYLGHECTENSMYIYLDYVPGGSMASILREFGPLNERLLQKSACGVLQGLDYLHSLQPPVVHRDIKCSNILVDLGFVVKLADFGCSKCCAVTKSFTTMGSIPWMAPEVIRLVDGYGRKADVWSFGCAVIEMATGEKPWGNNVFDNVMYALRHIGMSGESPAVPAFLPDVAQELIRSCTRICPDERPGASELLQHEFFTLWKA